MLLGFQKDVADAALRVFALNLAFLLITRGKAGAAAGRPPYSATRRRRHGVGGPKVPTTVVLRGDSTPCHVISGLAESMDSLRGHSATLPVPTAQSGSDRRSQAA